MSIAQSEGPIEGDVLFAPPAGQEVLVDASVIFAFRPTKSFYS
jgi:hypothetical protein